ncbi:hypothetical protein Leryth_027555 [Lithospermum erythrorhizon]|nr:hypothetical protein Leryth_027555 [Lithospermum erythrorhizon]
MTKEEVIDREWVCPPTPPSNSSRWPTFPHTHFPTDSDRHFSSPDVQAWSVGNQMQLDVVLQVKNFFKHHHQHTDEDEDEDDVEDDVDEDDEDSDDSDGANADCSLFFSKLFEDNKELREFYEKNREKGEFACLVCGGVGFIKRFKDCVSLVQHTVSISKTKKIKAHRDFGKVVGKLLGWDINKLPSKHQHLNANAPDVREEATGNDNSPTTHFSNLPQEPHKEDGSGKNESEDNQ